MKVFTSRYDLQAVNKASSLDETRAILEFNLKKHGRFGCHFVGMDLVHLLSGKSLGLNTAIKY
jgi:hypothetical protein